MRINQLILTCFILLILSACIGSSQYKEQFDGKCPSLALEQTVKDSVLEYSIILPSEYEVIRNFDVLNFSSVKPSDRDDYIESCGLTVERNSMNFRLNEFYENATYWDVEEYEKDFDNFSIVEQGNIIINDVEYKWNSYLYGNEQTLNIFGISNGLTYRLMFLSNQQHFDSLFCNYVNITKSLKIGTESL